MAFTRRMHAYGTRPRGESSPKNHADMFDKALGSLLLQAVRSGSREPSGRVSLALHARSVFFELVLELSW